MNVSDNAGYYRRRLDESRSRAAIATQPEVRRAHAEMAQRYQLLLADAEGSTPSRPGLGIVTGG